MISFLISDNADLNAFTLGELAALASTTNACACISKMFPYSFKMIPNILSTDGDMYSPTTFFLQFSPCVPTNKMRAGLLDLPLSPEREKLVLTKVSSLVEASTKLLCISSLLSARRGD